MSDSIEIRFGDDVPHAMDLHWCEFVSAHAWQAYSLSVRIGRWDAFAISVLLDRPRSDIDKYKAEIDATRDRVASG